MSDDFYMDNYGKGRTSVIDEMILSCDKQVEELNTRVLLNDKKVMHHHIHLKGKITAFKLMKSILIGKKMKTKAFNDQLNDR